MKKSVIIILMLHFVSIIVAQNCYRETRKEAISAFGQKNPINQKVMIWLIG